MDWITYSAKEAFGLQIGSGSHFDGTLPDSAVVGSCEGKSGSASTFSDEYKEYLGRLWEVQADAFEAGGGWIMWAWVSLLHQGRCRPSHGPRACALFRSSLVLTPPCPFHPHRKWSPPRTGRTKTASRADGFPRTRLRAGSATSVLE